MCSTQARHRAQHRDDPGAEWQFWSARGLVDRDGQRGSAKHARNVPSRYASHVGRVGALAVSLGIGLAVANSSGVAYAETKSESGGDTGSVSSNPGPSPSASSEPSGDEAADGEDSDDAEEADPVDVDDPDADEDNDSVEPDDIEEELEPATPDLEQDDETPSPPPDVPTDEPVDRPSGGDDEPAAPTPTDDAATIRESQEFAKTVDESIVGGDDGEEAAPQTQRVALDGVTTASTVAPVSDVQESVETITMVSALVSNVVSPFADPEAPAQAPWLDALLAWVRRQISHTFFNKTPVLTKAVETEQILASYWITLDAVDPNGDLLKYEIVQPSTGLVTRELISGKFIYTPFLPPVGDPRTDTIQIIVRDSTEHLTGALGTFEEVLHSIARSWGLAQPDDLTVNIDVVVNPLVKFPPLVTPISGSGFTLGGAPAQVVSAVDIVDGDSDYLSKAVLEVTAFAQDGDTLGYVAPVDNPIDGVVSVDGKTLTLTGHGTKAQYEEALKAVTFTATGGALLVRTVTISVTDDREVENIAPGFVLVGVFPAIKFPPLVTPISGSGFTLGGAPAQVVSAVDIVDGDSDYLSKAVLEVTAFAQDGDTLGYVAPVDNPIDGVVSVDGKTLTLTGHGTKAQYEEALKAVTFTATGGALLVRTVTISVTDADGVANLAPGFVFVGVKFSDAPTVLTVGTPTFTLGGGAVKVLSSATIGDTDSSHLSGAAVKLTTLAQGGDVLAFAPIGGVPISGSWDGNSKTLTLSGVATKAQYEQALEAVTFTATGGALLVRGVSISVKDDTGVGSIIPGAALINVKFSDAPTVLTVGTPTYTLGTSPVKVLSSATIGDTDSSHLSGAAVKLTTLAQGGDVLAFAPIGGVPISGSWDGNSKTLTLSGVATKAQYEQALEAVTFTATGGALLVRGVSISVKDETGVGSIIPGAALINVRENSAPILLIAGVSSYGLNDSPIKPLKSVTITDDLDTLSGATVEVTAFERTNDVLGYVQPAGNPVTVSSWDPGSHTLKLSGTGTAAQYEEALKAVTFWTNQGAVTTRSITIYVTDNAGKDSLTGLVTVSVWL